MLEVSGTLVTYNFEHHGFIQPLQTHFQHSLRIGKTPHTNTFLKNKIHRFAIFLKFSL